MSRTRFYALIFVLAAGVLGGSWGLRKLLMGLPDNRTLEDYQPSLSTLPVRCRRVPMGSRSGQ